MESTRRTAGLGLLAYGIGTAAAFLSIGAPGGGYSDSTVTNYLSSGHWAIAIALAYLGAFAALGLLVFADRMRHELRSGGSAFWALAVAGTTTAVTGWFLVGGISVAFAEGGQPLEALPHPVIYLVSEMSNLIAVCASAFFAGLAALLLAAKGALPKPLRIASYVAGACGVLAAFFFTLFLFWLWAIAVGLWAVTADARTPGQATVPAKTV